MEDRQCEECLTDLKVCKHATVANSELTPLLACDGWSKDLGCDGTATVFKPGYGKKKYCERCANRLEAANREWIYLTS